MAKIKTYSNYVVFTLFAALPIAGGCTAAVVGAGAGGAGAIAFTERGAKGEVKGDVAKVARNAQGVFKEMGIRTTDTAVKSGGQEQDLKGKSTKADVTVNITSTGKDTASVEVVAQESTLKWNKDYAKQILSKIVEMS